MARARALESDLLAATSAVRAKVDSFQVFVDELFLRYGMIKGKDRLEADGSIVRGEGTK